MWVLMAWELTLDVKTTDDRIMWSTIDLDKEFSDFKGGKWSRQREYIYVICRLSPQLKLVFRCHENSTANEMHHERPL